MATMVNPCLRCQFTIRVMSMSEKARFRCDFLFSTFARLRSSESGRKGA